MQPLWSHSITSTVIAEAKPRVGSIRSSSVAGLYTAGLVHDVGRLGLLVATEKARATFTFICRTVGV